MDGGGCATVVVLLMGKMTGSKDQEYQLGY